MRTTVFSFGSSARRFGRLREDATFRSPQSHHDRQMAAPARAAADNALKCRFAIRDPLFLL